MQKAFDFSSTMSGVTQEMIKMGKRSDGGCCGGGEGRM